MALAMVARSRRSDCRRCRQTTGALCPTPRPPVAVQPGAQRAGKGRQPVCRTDRLDTLKPRRAPGRTLARRSRVPQRTHLPSQVRCGDRRVAAQVGPLPARASYGGIRASLRLKIAPLPRHARRTMNAEGAPHKRCHGRRFAPSDRTLRAPGFAFGQGPPIAHLTGDELQSIRFSSRSPPA